MGAINYGTSEYITIGLKPYNHEDYMTETWCHRSMLARHLKNLYRITGKRFENWENVCIIRTEFLPKY